MTGMIYLMIAIISEVFGTAALKASEGFSHLWPSVSVVITYALSFYFLALSLKTIPLGAGYAMWSGIGTVLTVIVGVVIWKEAVSLTSILGILLIISGVIILNLNKFSIG